MTQSPVKTVSLALGSGGARGLAHIGVIKWLEENNVKITAISGASMGALIGGIYAAGKLDEYADWVTALDKTDVIRYLDLSLGSKGLFKGEKIIAALKELVGDHDIESLSTAFTAVATDIENEREVWLSEGSLFDAIRASIALPGIFTPFKHNNRILLDGGLTNPVPIAPTFRHSADLTIAVNLHGRPMKKQKEKTEPTDTEVDNTDYSKRIAKFFDDLLANLTPSEEDGLGFFDTLFRSLDCMQDTIVRFKLAAYSPNIIVEIPRNVCLSYEFYRAKELIQIGKNQAAEKLAHLVKS